MSGKKKLNKKISLLKNNFSLHSLFTFEKIVYLLNVESKHAVK